MFLSELEYEYMIKSTVAAWFRKANRVLGFLKGERWGCELIFLDHDQTLTHIDTDRVGGGRRGVIKEENTNKKEEEENERFEMVVTSKMRGAMATHGNRESEH